MIKHTGERIHMIGIGGAGMSPIAELLLTLGYSVTGSDRSPSPAADRLASLGIAIQYHHDPLFIKDADIVVYSSAIREQNSERVWALANKKNQIRRAEMLGDLMRASTTVCIAGTHGKTTTTSLTGTIMHAAELHPTVLIGGMLIGKGTHALIGNGTLMVAEADEYDRSFLAMFPTVAVVTNIDEDHLDCYHDLEAIKDAFVAFVKRIPFYGTLIACIDDAGVRDVLPRISARTITYGIDSGDAQYTARNIRFDNGCATFELVEAGESRGTISLAIPGMHNVRNALASIAVARLFGVSITVCAGALQQFGGVHRRFEIRSVVNNITIVDDYAHHPREISATLEAARTVCRGNVVAIFQPHLYTRTRDFMHEFAEALLVADCIAVTDIYKSREEPIEGVHAEGIVEQCRALGHKNVWYHADTTLLLDWLKGRLTGGDYAVFMGAGDINVAAEKLAGVLHGKA